MRVSVLGEQAIVDDESGGVRTRSSRAVVLVAFLAFHAGSSQRRQQIAGLFWPDSTDAQALTNLRRELHYLRQVLGDDPSLVVTSRDQKVMRLINAATGELLREDADPVWTDVIDGVPAQLSNGDVVWTAISGDTRGLVIAPANRFAT